MYVCLSVSLSVSLFVCPSHDLASGPSVRKMMNCAWRVQGHGKLRWRLVLTRAMVFPFVDHTQEHRKERERGSRKGASETETETERDGDLQHSCSCRDPLSGSLRDRSLVHFSKHALSRRLQFQRAKICKIVGLCCPDQQESKRPHQRTKRTADGKGPERRGRRTKGEEEEKRPTKGEVMNIMPFDNTKNAVAS